MKKQEKSEDLGVKFGSDEMVFWRNLIEAKKMDLKITKENLKFYEAILEMAEKKFKEAEEDFNKSLR
jgi:hypothetical protein